jgi:hypothetical protein
MPLARSALLALSVLASTALAEEPVDSQAAAPALTPPARRNYVAVVVGISAYDHLPDATELNFGRSDAATVAAALKESGGYQHVFLLGDGEASKAAITEVLRTRAPQHLGPDDVFLLYFVGHGIGADLGLPVILASDSTLQNGQEDGFELGALARDLQTWIRAGTALVVTDVVHRNQLDGISFFGPAATEWPALPSNWMLLSASGAQQAGEDGAFGKVFADGITGAADANRDGVVTGAELHAYTVSRLSPSGQIPATGGEFSPDLIVAQGVRGRPVDPVTPVTPVTPVMPVEPPPLPPPQVVLPDWSVSAAKFVWTTGAGQTVQCREQPVTACAPSCYVRQFLAGPCKLKGIFEGVEMTGEVMVLGPGKYDCARKGGELVCTGP